MNIRQRLNNLETSAGAKVTMSKPAPAFSHEQWLSMLGYGEDKNIAHKPFSAEQVEWLNKIEGVEL